MELPFFILSTESCQPFLLRGSPHVGVGTVGIVFDPMEQEFHVTFQEDGKASLFQNLYIQRIQDDASATGDDDMGLLAVLF